MPVGQQRRNHKRNDAEQDNYSVPGQAAPFDESDKSLVEILRAPGVPVSVFQHVVELQNTSGKEVADQGIVREIAGVGIRFTGAVGRRRPG